MDAVEKEKHRRILEAEDGDFLSRNWKASAEAFLAAVQAGEDIGDIVDLLAHTYRQCSQVPAMQPLAKAVVLQCLRSKDVQRLARIVQSVAYPEYFIHAMESAAASGADILPHVPWMLSNSTDEHTLARILCSHAGLDGSALVPAVNLLGSTEAGQKILPRFLQECVERKVDLTWALPALRPMIAQDSTRKRIVAVLVWIAQAGVDLSELEETLQSCIQDKDSGVRSDAAHCLAFHRTRKLGPEAADFLFSHTDFVVRRSAIAALGLRQRMIPAIGAFDRLVRALFDPEAEVRGKGFVFLRSACANGQVFDIAPALMQELANSARHPEKTAVICEFLFYFLAARPEHAARIRTALPQIPEFAALRRGPAAVCAVCISIPRSQTYSNEGDVPSAVEVLERVSAEMHGLLAELRRCRQCGTYYAYNFEEETEDMVRYVTISVRRLTPDEILSTAKGSLRTELETKLPALLTQSRQNRDHPVRREREEAAWILSVHSLNSEDYAALADLLQSPDEVLRFQAMTALSERIKETRTPEKWSSLAPNLKAALEDSSEPVQVAAAQTLAYLGIQKRQSTAVLELLLHKKAAVIAAAAELLWLGAAAIEFDSRLVQRLRDLVTHPDELVRRYAAYCLKSAGYPGGLSVFREALRNADAKTRCDAADALRGACEAGEDVSDSISDLVEMLPDPETAWHANETLKKAARAGISILPALPVICRLLSRQEGMRLEFLETLGAMRAGGADLSGQISALGPLLKDRRCGYSVLSLIEKLPTKTLATIEQDLRAAMNGKNFESLHETCCYLLTRVLVGQNRMNQVSEILTHEMRQIRGACVSILNTLCREGHGASFVPLAPVIARNLEIQSEFLRRDTISLLLAIAANSANAREEVLRAARQFRVPAAVEVLARLQS